jgi:hypothetical protein
MVDVITNYQYPTSFLILTLIFKPFNMRYSCYLLLLLIMQCSCNSEGKKQTENENDSKNKAIIVDNNVLDSTKVQAMESAIESGEYPNIHSVLIALNNKLIYENYWPGQDESWGDKLGNN